MSCRLGGCGAEIGLGIGHRRHRQGGGRNASNASRNRVDLLGVNLVAVVFRADAPDFVFLVVGGHVLCAVVELLRRISSQMFPEFCRVYGP